jgi:hypothetical protein
MASNHFFLPGRCRAAIFGGKPSRAQIALFGSGAFKTPEIED